MKLSACVALLAFGPALPALAGEPRDRIEKPGAEQPLPTNRAEPTPPLARAEPTPPVEQIDPYGTRKRIYIGGAITLGIGLLQLGLGIFGAIKVRERYDEAAVLCANVDPPWGCPDDAIGEMEAARHDSELPIYGIGFGAVSTLIGTILLGAAHTAALDVAIEPASNGALLTLKGAF